MTDPIARFLDEQAGAGSWPGAAWVVQEDDRTVSAGAVGRIGHGKDAPAASLETIYDLASLTKPLCTAALLALLDAEGVLDLEAPAERFLPRLVSAREGRPTLMDLATHRAGLPAWRPFYLEARTPGEIVDAAMRLALEAPSGTRVLYSDPGYILLGEVLRRAAGRALDALFAEKITGPLGLRTIRFRPDPSVRDPVAPTEAGNRFEARLAQEFTDAERPDESATAPQDEETYRSEVLPTRTGNNVSAAEAAAPEAAPSSREARGGSRLGSSLRDVISPGEVHDGNAHALGGVAGHAGLFGNALETSRLARQFLGPDGGLFGAKALRLFRENATPGLEEGRSLGFKLAVDGAREAQGALPPEAFGHTGFTGTSVWLDPTRSRSYVLLTNRVHPEVRAIDMNALRWRFHEIASKLS